MAVILERKQNKILLESAEGQGAKGSIYIRIKHSEPLNAIMYQKKESIAEKLLLHLLILY